MNLVLGLAAGFGLSLVIAVAFLFRRLLAYPKNLPVSVDWISDLSAVRYRPMERLLAEADDRFLASQPGCDKKMLRRMRADRRRLFRGYLACLSRDFGRICGALKLLITYSAQDRPDLAHILYTQQLRFTAGLLAVEARLFLHACGLGTVDVSGLVNAMECMRLELRQMVPVENGVAA